MEIIEKKTLRGKQMHEAFSSGILGLKVAASSAAAIILFLFKQPQTVQNCEDCDANVAKDCKPHI